MDRRTEIAFAIATLATGGLISAGEISANEGAE